MKRRTKTETPQYEVSIPSRDRLLALLKEAGSPLDSKAITARLHMESPAERQAVRKRLKAMVRDGQIIRDEHTIRLPPTWAHDKMKVYVGIWRGNERMPVLSGEKDPEGRLLAATIPVNATVAPQPSAKRS